MNKKGGEKWLSIWWFFVLVVIGGGVVIGVLIYYNADIDTKELEADVLAERIDRCLVDNGYLREDALNEDFNIFQECELRESMFGKGGDFYFNISIYDESGALLRDEILAGDVSFEENCKISGALRARHFPKCSGKSESAYYQDEEGKTAGAVKKARLRILAGSNQNIKKVNVI